MDTRLQRLIELIQQALELLQKIRVLNRELLDRVANANPDTVKQIVTDFERNMEELGAQQEKILQEALSIAQDLGKNPPGGEPPPAPPPIKAGDVASQFRNLMDTIQVDARIPRDSETSTTLKSLEVELKGLIVVENNEAKIVTPAPGSQVDPGLLSTIRLSYGTIPVLRPREAAAPPPTEPGKPK